jgi:hypothetical protein
VLHSGQDVVAGAIEDSVDARRCIACEPFAQRFHDGNGAADGGFEIERDLVLFCNARQPRSVPRKQRLVGGDH